MTIDIILYILLVMIFWDFSCHVIKWLGGEEKFTRSKSIFSYYYPHFNWMKTPNGPVQRPNWRKYYDRFWVAYWGIAFVL
ncbi:MAG: hypothetical protein UY32_C0011G0006 [Candidatus Jorgensenbacteria bacterium GW2011_GWC1_48_8]|uniref:Uncharacterized protein n=1 Tax=Candidatus Jorgensenbacteria bacterium GW2011_GWC1_48_8 TaxID=1618666 RepID=A0A0G1UXX5_9BACT|nr:MAG: hypothetical protein UY32_C0011G0006 [Candidatus Jorgensenbacteria bacterium GW2011_GWC1_48_8]